MMNRLAATVVAGTLLAFSMMAASQTAGAQTAAAPAASDKDPHVISSQDLAMLRKDIRSQKKQLMARNLTLSDTNATKFWPIYDQYTAELTKINDKKYSTIQEFADHFGSMTDEKATTLIQQWLDVDTAVTQLRAKYLPIVTKAIGGRNGASWAQLDRRIQMMVDLQLASRTPLVQSQGQ
jgi:Spy/CpxP family protein refolding chaperone